MRIRRDCTHSLFGFGLVVTLLVWLGIAAAIGGNREPAKKSPGLSEGLRAANANIPNGEKPMPQPKIVQPSNVKWEPHPLVAGIESAFLVSKRDENIDLTCMLVHVPAGTRVDNHTHQCDEIIYVIEGKATMHIDRIGEVPMVAGTFLRIPKDVAHYPYDIEKDIKVYDVFYPFLR